MKYKAKKGNRIKRYFTDIEIIKVPSVIIIKSIIFSLLNILITDIKYIIINELWEYILVKIEFTKRFFFQLLSSLILGFYLFSNILVFPAILSIYS